LFGRKTLEGLGLDPERAAAIEEFVRRRDLDRLALQQAEGITAGLDLLRAQMAQEPLSKPARETRPLNPEAQEIVRRPPAAE
jgi:CPA2 family monovalent cation:H+ antiporter-2